MRRTLMEDLERHSLVAFRYLLKKHDKNQFTGSRNAAIKNQVFFDFGRLVKNKWDLVDLELSGLI